MILFHYSRYSTSTVLHGHSMLFLILLILFVSHQSRARSLNKGIVQFEKQLRKIIRRYGRFDLIDKGFKSFVDGKIEMQPIKIDHVALNFRNNLTAFLDKKARALRRLVDAAESGAKPYSYDAHRIQEIGGATCAYYMRKIEKINVKKVGMHTNDSSPVFLQRVPEWQKSSGVHINVETYHCDNAVLRDLEWTDSIDLDQAFKENIRSDPSIHRQYVGTLSGLTRLFPARPWLLTPPRITLDLFDPRFRPWYISAESTPKDIMFLIDYSGSVKGQTLWLIKMSILHIMATLTANDFINAVWYNSKMGLIMDGCFRGFLPATTRNKGLLYESLELIEAQDQAILSPALNYSFWQFKSVYSWKLRLFLKNYGNTCYELCNNNVEVVLVSSHPPPLLLPQHQSSADIFWMSSDNSSSGGHHLVMLFTDAIETWPVETINPHSESTDPARVRVFGFAMVLLALHMPGYESEHMPALHWMSCTTHGFHTVINEPGDVRHKARTFVPILSRVLALDYRNTQAEDRQIIWTGPYMDAQGDGPMLTLSMALLNSMNNGSGQQLMGVAAIDVPLTDLTRLLDVNDVEVFVIDNNGNVLFHPDSESQPQDLHAIRRTACYDTTPRNGNEKLLFGQIDDQILRQLGLLDSISTTDLLELEHHSQITEQLRKSMVDQTCDGTIHKDVIDYELNGSETLLHIQLHKQYSCLNLPHTPYSVAIRSVNSPKSVIFKQSFWNGPVFRSRMIAQFLSPKRLCNGQLDLSSTEMDDRTRFDSFIKAIEQDCNPDSDTNFLIANLASLNNWMRSWGDVFENETCEQMISKNDFFDASFISVFVKTGAGITVVYPTCVLDNNINQIKPINSAGILHIESGRNMITLSRSIFDSLHGRLMARLSIQFDSGYINRLWRMKTENHPLWRRCWRKRISHYCHLLTSDAVVVASSGKLFHRPSHFGRWDGQLFDELIANGVIKKTVRRDYQSTCVRVDISASSSSSSAMSRNLITSLWQLWSSGFMRICASNVPIFVDNKCEYKESGMEEKCTMDHYEYTFDISMDFSGRTNGNGSNCRRRYSIIPFTKSNLFLIIVENACIWETSKMTDHQLDSVRVSDCEQASIRYRRRLSENGYNHFNLMARFYFQALLTLLLGGLYGMQLL